jgi:hypothetical protein
VGSGPIPPAADPGPMGSMEEDEDDRGRVDVKVSMLNGEEMAVVILFIEYRVRLGVVQMVGRW